MLSIKFKSNVLYAMKLFILYTMRLLHDDFMTLYFLNVISQCIEEKVETRMMKFGDGSNVAV